MNIQKPLIHILWTTFDTLPVWDKNGNWDEFAKKYQILKENKIDFTTSHKLYSKYNNQIEKPTTRFLSDKAIIKLEADILNLTKPNADRIINELNIAHLKITNVSVEILLFSDDLNINQKIARLKSRTATLLHFSFPEAFNGRQTWSKGYWQSTFKKNQNLALNILKDS
jgi:hypothetical protein